MRINPFSFPPISGGTVQRDKKPTDSQPAPDRFICDSGDKISLRFGRAGDSIQVMTLNTENFRETQWPSLAGLIRDRDPDIMALQEVGNRNKLTCFLRNYLPQYQEMAHTFQDGNHGLAIIAKPKFTVESTQAHTPFVCSRYAHSHRPFLEAIIETDDGYRIKVITVHFKASGPHHAQQNRILKSRVMKREESKYLAEIMLQHMQHSPDIPLIVLGDFNMFPDDPLIRKLQYHPFPYYKIKKKLFFEPSLDNGHTPSPTFLSRRVRHLPQEENEGRKLDYIFLSQAVPAANYIEPDHLRDPILSATSDHAPVSVTFTEPDLTRHKQFDRVA